MCDCEVCKYGIKVKDNLEKIPQDQQEFFRDMYIRLCSAETDYEYLKSIKIPELMEKLKRIEGE